MLLPALIVCCQFDKTVIVVNIFESGLGFCFGEGGRSDDPGKLGNRLRKGSRLARTGAVARMETDRRSRPTGMLTYHPRVRRLRIDVGEPTLVELNVGIKNQTVVIGWVRMSLKMMHEKG